MEKLQININLYYSHGMKRNETSSHFSQSTASLSSQYSKEMCKFYWRVARCILSFRFPTLL